MQMTCLLVGGVKAKQLGDFIEENSGKSVIISNVFTSFSDDEDKFNKLMVRANKLIWLINESKNLRSDLNVLNNCIKNRTYFSVKEIYIFGTRDENTLEAERIFKLLMEENEFTSYRVSLTEEPSNFQSIYRELMGTSEADTKVTKRKAVYRATRVDDSKRGYDPEEYNKNISIQEEDRRKSYEEIKKAAIKTETNQIIKELPEKVIPRIDLNISDIEIEEIKYKRNIFIVCGKPKAGTSTLAVNLAKFLMEKGTTNVIDISANFGSVIYLMENLGLDKINNRTLVDNTLLLTGKDFSNRDLAVYSPIKLHNRSLLISYLKYVMSIPNRTISDNVVIDCCIDDIEEIMNVCGTRIARIFIACQDTRNELVIIKNKVKSIIDTNNAHTIFLNRSIKYDKKVSRVTAVSAKKIIKNGSFTGYIDFETEEADFSELIKVV